MSEFDFKPDNSNPDNEHGEEKYALKETQHCDDDGNDITNSTLEIKMEPLLHDEKLQTRENKIKVREVNCIQCE